LFLVKKKKMVSAFSLAVAMAVVTLVAEASIKMDTTGATTKFMDEYQR
jgi:hypothetical protein